MGGQTRPGLASQPIRREETLVRCHRKHLVACTLRFQVESENVSINLRDQLNPAESVTVLIRGRDGPTQTAFKGLRPQCYVKH